MAQDNNRQVERRAERWARMNFPNKFVHPHEYTARDRRMFDKMFISIPPGAPADPTNAVTSAEPGRAL